MTWEIINGDCLDVMRTYPDNHFSGIVTDPPYGLSFLGKGWDHEVPDRSYWEECLRITKPGSFLIAMGGTRTFHRLACAIEEGGYEIRDCVSWIYASGFPKSHNHFGIDGFGTALKPAWEPCIVAMKPLDGTFKQSAEKWGQAGINIDGCRIDSRATSFKDNRQERTNDIYGKFHPSDYNGDKGRWPANVILDEEAALNIGVPSRFFFCAKTSPRERNEGLGGLVVRQTIGGGGTNNTEDDVCGKYGSIKAPSKNHHPTVKPLSLMRYLITLIAPPSNALILDPFAGSGTTVLAAHQLGISALGIEQSSDYCEIARARLQHSIDKKRDTPEQLEFV